MKASFEVRNAPHDYTIRIRMTGKFDAKTMREFAADYKKETGHYEGNSHLVLADMRGMVPTTPEVGHIFSEAIAYCRARGVLCCAHISDDTVLRLQTARLARGRTQNDQITVEVVSVEEAERVLNEVRIKLKDSVPPRTSGSVPSMAASRPAGSGKPGPDAPRSGPPSSDGPGTSGSGTSGSGASSDKPARL